jgi:GNAT superfamily N-acetyltransferase
VPEDAEAVAALRRVLVTTEVSTAGTLLNALRPSERTRAACWVAEEAGRLVGFARAGWWWETGPGGPATAWVGVLEEARGRGLGRALAELAETHVTDAPGVRAWTDCDAGDRFARSRGYELTSRAPVSRLAVGRMEMPEPPSGVRLATWASLVDRARELCELDRVAAADEPDAEPGAEWDFDEWCATTLHAPQLAAEGSFVALVGDRMASLCLLGWDGRDRAENDFTGTHPDFRGRGLATLVKRASIAWAAANGVREIFTGNDERNAAMLAVNRKLGYQPVMIRRRWRREAAAASGPAPGAPAR